ncbi:MAG TPA: glycoside hydrolase family 43 protein [Clostridia bacterium]|nr:glycoside hydrolase family 43 protein [Clostridia bacterium]
MIVNNPILRGFYPDPSVCKVNGKYFMVCSSFQYFPGVPIFESDDLIHWKQIGHCLTRPSQVDLREVNSSGGVFAPTIRYYDSTFYMVTTNDTYHKNFYISTTDIYGEWSDPIFVDQGGIDPSLFFEDDKTYFMSNGSDKNGDGCIFQCEIDVKTGEKLTESKPVWKGTGGRYLESPHLYHLGDWYYIMAAEGGTEYGHMITYARGISPYGPFVPYHKNPVLTNRNLGGHQSLIQGIGHGDLIQDDEGNTFIVCLGFRQAGEWVPYHHLGREVFLVPVQWDAEGWFTAGVNGVVKQKMQVSIKDKTEATGYDASIQIMKNTPHRWCYLREPQFENYQILDNKIRLRGTEVTLHSAGSPTFLGIHQSEFDTILTVNVSCINGEAGVTYYMDENHHYDLALANENNGTKKVILRLSVGDLKTVVNQILLPPESTNISLHVESDPLYYSFYCYANGENTFLGKAQAKYLSTEVAGGFTGVVMAMYAIQNESNAENWAEFSSFHWKQKSDV